MRIKNESGIALLTSLMLLLILLILGIAAITTTGFENRIAGLASSSEAASAAAESCIGTAVNVIQQTIDRGEVPTGTGGFVPTPIPSTTMATSLEDEIMGRSDNNVDGTSGVSNMVQQVGVFTVNGDIDRLYHRAKAGGSLQFASGNEGTGTEGAVDIYYRIDCVASLASTGTNSRVTAVYACTKTGESCQRKS